MILHALLIGALVGVVVGSLGAGGGIVSVPILVYVLGQDPHQATGLSLIIVGLTAAVSLATRARSGNVAWREGTIFAFAGLAGTWAGAALAPLVSARTLMLSFCALLEAVAIFMVRSQLRPVDSSSHEAEAQLRDQRPLHSTGTRIAVLAGRILTTAAEAAGASSALRRRTGPSASGIPLLRTEPLLVNATILLIVTGTLLDISGPLLIVLRVLTVTRTEVIALSPAALVVGTVLVSLFVVVLSIPHHGGVSDDTRAKADGEDSGGCSGDSRALAPRGLLRCRLPCRGASSHGLVTRLIVGRSPRDRLQGRVGERASPLLLGDRWHLRRFRLRFMGGQHLGLLRNLRL